MPTAVAMWAGSESGVRTQSRPVDPVEAERQLVELATAGQAGAFARRSLRHSVARARCARRKRGPACRGCPPRDRQPPRSAGAQLRNSWLEHGLTINVGCESGSHGAHTPAPSTATESASASSASRSRGARRSRTGRRARARGCAPRLLIREQPLQLTRARVRSKPSLMRAGTAAATSWRAVRSACAAARRTTRWRAARGAVAGGCRPTSCRRPRTRCPGRVRAACARSLPMIQVRRVEGTHPAACARPAARDRCRRARRAAECTGCAVAGRAGAGTSDSSDGEPRADGEESAPE